MTGPGPYLDADRLYFLVNAVPALAERLGVLLDRDGNSVAPPAETTLVEEIAALVYARHTTDAYGRWAGLGRRRRASWLTTAEAIVRLAAAPRADGSVA